MPILKFENLFCREKIFLARIYKWHKRICYILKKVEIKRLIEKREIKCEIEEVQDEESFEMENV